MDLVDVRSLPFIQFGDVLMRKVRVAISPDTTAEGRISIVECELPAGAISEGHTHLDSDEYIRFDGSGEAVLNGKVYKVPEGGVIHAPKGVMHECRNISDKILTLYCVFVPPLNPYGKYPELIDSTKKYFGR